VAHVSVIWDSPATSAKNSYPNPWRKGILGGRSDAMEQITIAADILHRSAVFYISPEDAPTFWD
jgi:hypothetical protein